VDAQLRRAVVVQDPRDPRLVNAQLRRAVVVQDPRNPRPVQIDSFVFFAS
jgi:hypothetical protein